jgi:aryl-alcohol dehydrogenase-like predicted oxidoreductase
LEYRRLGKSGLEVSLVGIGCNQFGGKVDREQTAAIAHRALDLGVNFFDTSDTYPAGGGKKGDSEVVLGSALKAHRRDAVIATKFANAMGEGPGWRGTSRRYIRNAVTDSLRRLQTDYIDLYQVHMPDSTTPILETMSALDDLVHEGLVRYVGCSNFSAWQIAEAQWTAKTEHLTPLISAQNQYNLLVRNVEAEVLPACEQYGLGMLPFYPLASGFLTGKYRQGESAPSDARLAGGGRMAERTLTDRNFASLQKLESFTERQGHSMLELAFAWLAAHPPVSSIIAGVTKPEQVEANVRAVEWTMSADELAEVNEIVKP